jgi:hypothetical protein
MEDSFIKLERITMQDKISISPEIHVESHDHGYIIMIEPLSRRDLRERIGPFRDKTVAMIWAKAKAEIRSRK